MFACKTGVGSEHLAFRATQLQYLKAAIGSFPDGPELAGRFVPTFPPSSFSNGCCVYEMAIIDSAYVRVTNQAVNECNRLNDDLKKETLDLLDTVERLFGDVPQYRSELPSNRICDPNDSLKVLWSLCGNLQLKRTVDDLHSMHQENDIQQYRKDLANLGMALSASAASRLYGEAKINQLSLNLEEADAMIRTLKEEADDTHEQIKSLAVQLDRILGVKPSKGRKKQDLLVRLESSIGIVEQRLRNSQPNRCTRNYQSDTVDPKFDEADKKVQDLERSLKALEDANNKLMDDYQCAREDRNRDKERVEQLSKQLEKLRAERAEEKSKSKKGKKQAKG